MTRLTDYPLLLSLVSVLVLWGAALAGGVLRRRHQLERDVREDFGVILAATLTLLGLIIGFSFSMAVGRYDQRKNYEEAEANAIGTEYVRADLLPAAAAANVRALLSRYLDQRILFYTARDPQQVAQITAETTRVQAALWTAVQVPASEQPTFVVLGLAVAGMNDVLNSQGYTQAAWWNRIPPAAWGLMGSIAICCNLLVGYGEHGQKVNPHLLLILPVLVAVAFLLIADIDSPNGGIIRVQPHNLVSLADSLRTH